MGSLALDIAGGFSWGGVFLLSFLLPATILIALIMLLIEFFGRKKK